MRARSTQYVRRVETYVREQGLKPEWAPKGVRKEQWVAARLESARRRQRFGLYAVLMSMEQGPSFRCVPSRRQPDNAHWIHLEAQWSRYRHYYFYLYDPVLGACCLRIGTFLPFVMTAWLNGHEFIARRLQGQRIPFTQCDNAIVACADAKALQAAADDIRKLKAHGLIQRVGQSYRWRLTVKGQKVAVLLLLLRKRVYGPLADSSFGARPDRTQPTPDCRWERAYHKVDAAMDELIECLAA